MRKIAELFSIFKSLTPAQKVAKAVKNGSIPSIYAENLNRVENANVRETLTEALSQVRVNTRRNQMRQSWLDELIWKLEVCDDTRIKALAEDLLSGTQGKSRITTFGNLFKAEHLLDVVNTATGKYCRLLSHRAPLGDVNAAEKVKAVVKARKKGNADNLEKAIQELETGYSEPRKLFRIKNRKGEPISGSIMKNESQFDSLREYIVGYPQDKETATYLWRKYFVSTQEPRFQKVMNEIYDTYGVRVVTNEETSLVNLLYLKEEFKIWQAASEGKAHFPELYDIRETYTMASCFGTSGHTDHTRYIANLPQEVCTTVPRHELAHMQEHVLKRRKVKPNEADRQELINAGISESNVDYFFFNERESWARFVEGNMEAYSEVFKQKMFSKSKNLPRWVTKLTHNSEAAAFYKGKFQGEKYERIIADIQEVIGDVYFKNKSELKLAHKICKRVPKGKKLSIEEFKEIYGYELKRMLQCRRDAKMRNVQQKIKNEFEKLREELDRQMADLDARLGAIRNQKYEPTEFKLDGPSILDRLG